MQNNNSQEYQSNQLKRESMLQQIILEQKQKIRELEQQSQKQQTPPIYKQQLQECTKQLEESKRIIQQLLQQKDQFTLQIEQMKKDQEILIQQQTLELQNQFNLKIKQLQNENQLLQEELQSYQPLSKALNNYTQEEKYIQQINKIHEFLTQWQKQTLSEIIFYKRELEIQQSQKEQQTNRYQEEKQQLQSQINEIMKKDDKIKNDVILQLQSILKEIQQYQNELKQLTLFKGNHEKIEELLISQIQSNKLDAFTFQNNSQISAKPLQNSSIINQMEQVQQSLEDEDKNNYLILENNELKHAIEDIKQLSLMREQTLKLEIQRYQDKCLSYQQQIEEREQIQIQQIQQLRQKIDQIKSNYQSREIFYKFNNEDLQQQLDTFRNITQQIETDLKNRKGNEHIKECKDLITKLVQNKTRQPKSIKSLDRLELICKDLLKNPQIFKNHEDLKNLIIEASQQILNSQEYKQQTILLFQALDQLEGIITCPTKRIDQLLDLFHTELQQLTKLREQTFMNNQICEEIQFQSENKQVTESQQNNYQFEIDHLNQLRQLEQEQYKKEINIITNRSQKFLEAKEDKIKNLEYQLRKQEQIFNQQYNSTSSQQTENEIKIKQLNKQAMKLQKQLVEAQQQRVQDKKEFYKLIQESENKQLESQNKLIKLFENRYLQIVEIINKKLKTLFKNQSNEKARIHVSEQQENQEIKTNQHNIEHEKQFKQKIEELTLILEELKTNINNLHEEKAQLIQQLDELSKVLSTQKKAYYSFRQQQQ